MALRWADSFGYYGDAQVASRYTDVAGFSIDPTGGAFGNPALKFQMSNGVGGFKLLDAQPTWHTGCRVKYASGSYPTRDTPCYQWRDGTTVQITLAFMPSGAIAMYRGVTQLAISANGVFPLGANFWLGTSVTINSTTGSFTVKVNDITVLTASGQNTQTTGTAAADTLGFVGGDGGNPHYLYIGDYVVRDATGVANNTIPSDRRVTALFPSGAGASTMWTPNGAGANYTKVNEHPPDEDTTYNSTGTVDDVDTYAADDLTGTGTVDGVIVHVRGRKDDAGVCKLAPVVYSGTTVYVGTEVAQSTDYTYIDEIWEQDPDTSAAWSYSGVNAMQPGVKRTA